MKHFSVRERTRNSSPGLSTGDVLAITVTISVIVIITAAVVCIVIGCVSYCKYDNNKPERGELKSSLHFAGHALHGGFFLYRHKLKKGDNVECPVSDQVHDEPPLSQVHQLYSFLVLPFYDS